jgi:hypothetical protein
LFDIFSLLQTQLKFDYTLAEAADGTYGILDANHEWTGLIGMINRGEADFTISALTRTYDREKVSDV